MNALIVSRSNLDAGAVRMLRSLPFVDSDVVALNVRGRGNWRRRAEDSSQTYSGPGDDRSDTVTLTEDCPEVVMTTGNLIREVMRVADQRKPDLIVLPQEEGRICSMVCLAADAVRILGCSRANVLLIPSKCSPSETSRVVVGAVAKNSRTAADTTCLRGVLDMDRAETVVVAVASPFHPPFSRVAPNMRGSQSHAMKEVWEEQAGDATAQARLIADQLAGGKTKPLYVGRTGGFVSQISQAVRSDDTALLCLLIDSLARKWLSKSTLLEMIESVNVPVLLAPANR